MEKLIFNIFFLSKMFGEQLSHNLNETVYRRNVHIVKCYKNYLRATVKGMRLPLLFPRGNNLKAINLS